MLSAPRTEPSKGLEFLWLEVTNQCNLQCGHCYADSGPYGGENDLLTAENYLQLLSDARALGCRQVQFIGGEPTLNRNLRSLVAHAAHLEYDFIEVFTNLVRLDDKLIQDFVERGVSLATSFYSDRAETHDAITCSPGSFKKTVRNIKRVIAANLPLRVGIIKMELNRNDIEKATTLLESFGVKNIGFDSIRGFGRAQSKDTCSMGDLCGKCAGDILAIGPDGVVAPCIMSKHWSVGNVLDGSLSDIIHSSKLSMVRGDIARAAGAVEMNCAPYKTPNCMPECVPSSHCQPCWPNGGHKCIPNDNCTPGGPKILATALSQ